MLYKIFQNSHCHKVYTTYCVDFDCLFKSCQYKERLGSVNIIEFDHYHEIIKRKKQIVFTSIIIC